MNISRVTAHLFRSAWIKLAAGVLLVILAAAIVQRPISAQTPPPPAESSYDNALCRVVGNNTAIPFAQSSSKRNHTEALYTLELIAGEMQFRDLAINNTVTAITNAYNANPEARVIVRWGASTTDHGPAADDYARMLVEISDRVGGKPFIAMVTHNEPNCAENIPVAEEAENALQVVTGVRNAGKGADKIKLIMGQLDTYCNNDPTLAFSNPNSDTPGPGAFAYMDAVLGSVVGSEIAGVSLPLYITPNFANGELARQLLSKYAEHAGGREIYVTESGPYLADSFREYLGAVQGALVKVPNLKTILLFNAFGDNTDQAFEYTEPFWSAACRKALRTICGNTDEVIAICGGDRGSVYVEPIDGLPQNDAALIEQTLVNQGYTVACAAPATVIKLEEGGALDKLVGNPILEVTSTFEFDASGSKVPLWRSDQVVNTDGQSDLFLSYEKMFGHLQASPFPDPDQQEISSAPIYRLTDAATQCNIKKNLLNIAKAKCDKLSVPEGCALYQPIADTEFTVKTLQEELQNISCNDLYQNSHRLEGSIGKEKAQKLQTAIQLTPFYLDKAYRLAFVVYSVDLKPSSPVAFFDFQLDNQGDGQGIKAVALLIPDILTSQNEDDPAAGIDPVTLTGNLMTNSGIQNQDKKVRHEEKLSILDKLRTKIFPTTLIKCVGPQCGDPLTQALVNLINAQGQSCDLPPEQFKTEDSSAIGIDGSLPESENLTFTSPTGEYNLIDNITARPLTDQESFSFLSNVRLKAGDGGGNETKGVAYLISPQDERNIAMVEGAISSLILDKNAQEKLVAADAAKYLPLQKSTFGFTSNKPSIQIPGQPTPNEPDATPIPNEAFATSTITGREPDGTLIHLPGARLGNTAMRALYSSLTEFGSKINTCLNNIKTTEDLFALRCEDVADSDTEPNPDVEQYCIDWEMTKMSEADKTQLVTNARTYLQNLPYSLPQKLQYMADAGGYTDYAGRAIPADRVNFYENYYGGGRALLWAQSDEYCDGKVCFEYIMEQCMAAGFNPALCISMNLSESGGSNYLRWPNDPDNPDDGTWDFGCKWPGDPQKGRNDVDTDLECLIKHFFIFHEGEDYGTMFLKYAAPQGFNSNSYPRIKQYYPLLSGGIGFTEGACPAQ